MKAVILAAGEGKRFRPLTYTKPKVLLHVAGKPIIQHIVDDLLAMNVEKIYIVTNYLEDQIKEYFSGEKKIEFLHQEKLGGTADAINQANFLKETFIVVNGDEVFDGKDIQNIVEAHKKHKALATVGAFEVEDPRLFGVLETEGKKIKKVVEKPEHPKNNLVNAGIHVYEPVIFDYIKKTKKSKRGEYEVTDSFQMLAHKTKKFSSTSLSPGKV